MVTPTTSLQGKLVLPCRSGCKAMGMRAAGQGSVARMQRSGIQDVCPSPLEGEGLGRRGSVASISGGVVLCADALCFGVGVRPTAEILSFASPKESIQRKGDPGYAPCGLAYGTPFAKRQSRQALGQPALPPQGRKPVLSAKALRTWLFESCGGCGTRAGIAVQHSNSPRRLPRSFLRCSARPTGLSPW